jgi:trimeric autotransporter adhesin
MNARITRLIAIVIALLSGITDNGVAAQPCSPHWEPGFHPRGVSGEVNTQVVFDDGTGPALYVAGHFGIAGNSIARNVARWTGTEWQAMDTGLYWDIGDPFVASLVVFDDGTGPAVYAGGTFRQSGSGAVQGIARWNGSNWVSLGIAPPQFVTAMTVFDDDGDGPEPAYLYVAGLFANVPGLGSDVRRLIKWTGTSWQAAVEPPLPTFASILRVLDDGSGPAIFAGSTNFAHAIQKWNGNSWVAASGSLTGRVNDLAFFDHDGLGPASASLYVAGDFDIAGTPTINDLARWDGSAWQAAGQPNSLASTLLAAEEGLYAGGSFTSIGAVNASGIALLDTSGEWSVVEAGSINGQCRGLEQLDLGNGPNLYAGGSFLVAGDTIAQSIARIEKGVWQNLGDGEGLNGSSARAFAIFDDGTGEHLFVSGGFSIAGGTFANNIAKRTATGWEALGDGVNGFANILAVYDDGLGDGPALYVAGNISSAGGVPVNKIAKWNGRVWSDVGGGVTGADAVLINAAAVFDEDGPGPLRPALFVGGTFFSAGGAPASKIARWDGASWTSLGGFTNEIVRSLVVHDDGSSPALYAAGTHFDQTGQNIRAVAKWNGTTWAPVGTMKGGSATALLSTPGGLYASGQLNFPGGISMTGTLRWNGSIWELFDGPLIPTAMALFDDGSGETIYVCGHIYGSGSSSSGIAKWDGAAFVPLQPRLTWGTPSTLFPVSTGPLAGLYAAGPFAETDGFTSYGIARYIGCAPCPADANGSGAVDVDDLVAVILGWGNCPKPPTACDADVNGSGAVDVDDLIAIILAWGGCP